MVYKFNNVVKVTNSFFFFFCIGGRGLELLDFIVHKLSLVFEKWNGETSLLTYTCQLILTLCQTPRIAPLLFLLPSWNKLMEAYFQGHPIFSFKISSSKIFYATVLKFTFYFSFFF